jgi:hypothetical protein
MSDNQQINKLPVAFEAGAISGTSRGLTRPDLDTAMQIGRLAWESKMFPDLQSAAQATMKILAGQELGLGPFVAMRDLFLIKGKIAMSAAQVGARIKNSGKYDYEIVELDDKGCKIEFRKGEKVLEPVSSFSQDDARKAGLLQKEGAMYEKYARNMYFSRALTNGARWHCPEVFGGAIYTPDELRGQQDDSEIVIEPSRSQAASTPVAALAAQPTVATATVTVKHEQAAVIETDEGPQLSKPTDPESVEYQAWVTQLSHGSKAGQQMGEQPYKYLKNYLNNYKAKLSPNELHALNVIMRLKLDTWLKSKSGSPSEHAEPEAQPQPATERRATGVNAVLNAFPKAAIETMDPKEIAQLDLPTLSKIKVIGGQHIGIEFERVAPDYLQVHLDTNRHRCTGTRAWYPVALERYLKLAGEAEQKRKEDFENDTMQWV